MVGLCRVPPASGGGVTYLSVDLTDADDCRAKLGALADTTHLFYAARAPHDEHATEDVAANLAMLRNVVEAAFPNTVRFNGAQQSKDEVVAVEPALDGVWSDVVVLGADPWRARSS